MIWILTAIYFLLCSAVLWFGFWFYGKALAYLGKTGIVIRNLGGLFVYVLFACVLVAPLFIALNFIGQWREEFHSNPIYMIYVMLLFLFAAVPGGLYFKKHYLSELKELGYFAKRR